MKCRACDVILTDTEATLKFESGEFIDMCFSCIGESELYHYEYEGEENGTEDN